MEPLIRAPRCCFSADEQCADDAEWEVYRESSTPHDPYEPYDYTQVCTRHVGELLYPGGSLVLPIEVGE